MESTSQDVQFYDFFGWCTNIEMGGRELELVYERNKILCKNKTKQAQDINIGGKKSLQKIFVSALSVDADADMHSRIFYIHSHCN